MVDDRVEAGNGGKRMNTGMVFFKTKLCSRFRSGNCPYITNCNFAHGADELRRPPPGWEDLVNPPGFAEDSGGGGGGGGRGGGNATRFRPCKRFFTDGICPYGERCIFSHEDHSTVNAKPANWKTRLCNKWETTGSCSFGETCHFAHGSAAVSPCETVSELQKFGGGRESLPSPQRSQRSSSYSDSFSRPEASSSLTSNMPHPQQQKPQLQLHLQSPQQQNPIQHQQLQQQQNHHQSQQQPQIQTQKPQPPPTSSTSSKVWRGPTDSAISTIYGDWLEEEEEEEEDEDESEDELGANEDEENHPMELFYEELRSFN